jgi:hypothetical protein
MDLTVGEYCQFSFDSQVQLLEEFGEKVFISQIRTIRVYVYSLNDFFVVCYCKKEQILVNKIEIFSNLLFIDFLEKSS